MKLRHAIGLIDQGMGSEYAAPTDKWFVAYHQVPDRHPPDRKIPGCSRVDGGAGCRGSHAVPDPLGGSMACGASMPCGAGTSIIVGPR